MHEIADRCRLAMFAKIDQGGCHGASATAVWEGNLKSGCPVSKALAAIDTTLDARLIS